MSERFKNIYVPWWKPVPLARWRSEDHEQGFEFIGWAWRQRAYLVKNISHGWIAFVDMQTPENLRECCPACGKPKDPS